MRPKNQWRRRLRRALRTLGACKDSIDAILANGRSLDHCLQQATTDDYLRANRTDTIWHAQGHGAWIICTIGEFEVAAELAERGDHYRSAIVIKYWITGVLHCGDDNDVCRALGSAWILRALEHHAEEIRRADSAFRRYLRRERRLEEAGRRM